MKKLINNILRKSGYKFSRIDNYEDIKYLWLASFDIKTILDIGANEGQFASKISKALPKAKLLSFEPLKDTFNILSAYMMKNSNMKTYNVALGDKNENAKIFKNEYTPSSSLLELGEKHLESFPDYEKVSFEEITVRRLDDFLNDEKIVLDMEVLLKMDVQGFEDKVIKGAEQTLKSVKVILVEVSFWELYKSQALFEDIFFLLKGFGFKYRGNFDVFYNKETGQPMFSDAIFIRE